LVRRRLRLFAATLNVQTESSVLVCGASRGNHRTRGTVVIERDPWALIISDHLYGRRHTVRRVCNRPAILRDSGRWHREIPGSADDDRRFRPRQGPPASPAHGPALEVRMASAGRLFELQRSMDNRAGNTRSRYLTSKEPHTVARACLQPEDDRPAIVVERH
jgi:hypothetical protein